MALLMLLVLPLRAAEEKSGDFDPAQLCWDISKTPTIGILQT